MFPGNKAGSFFPANLQKGLEETLYQEADFFMDLHGGDVNEALTPLIFFPTAVSEKLMHQTAAAAAALSVSYRVASTAKKWTLQLGCAVRDSIIAGRAGRTWFMESKRS